MTRRRSPLKLDETALRRLPPIEVDRLHQQAISRMLTTKRLTFEQWDTLVTEWNEHLTAEERRDRHRVCRRSGHDWTRAPVGARVCRRCCAYVIED